MREDRLTTYQVELLQHVRHGSPEDAGPVDFDQLLERLSWKPTKAAAQFSIRALIRRGLLQKTPELMLRRGRTRVGFLITQKGLELIDPRETKSPPPAVEDRLPEVDEVSLEEFLED